jgi:hypothetical protein
MISMSNNKFSFSRDCLSLPQLKSRSAIANRLSIESFYFAAMSHVRAFTKAVGLLLLLMYFHLDVNFLFVSSRCSRCWDANSCSLSVFSLLGLSPLVFRPTYLFRNRWLPTKFPLLLARRQARARLLREYSILSGESSLTFFSSESTVPRAFADRFVRVKSIYYLVPGIFVFVETLWMVCCIVSVWKI